MTSIEEVIIDWGSSFNAYLDRLDADAATGSREARAVRSRVYAALDALQDLDAEPIEETPTFKRVRQSGQYGVWRVAHPFDPLAAVRLIVWFPSNQTAVVVALFAGNKKAIGDVWYDSVATRADAEVKAWLFQTKTEKLGVEDDEW